MATVRLMRGAESDVATADGSLRIAIVAGLEKLLIIFRYDAQTDEVFVLAIAARKDATVYHLATERLFGC